MKKANPDYTVHELCLLFQLSERTYYAQVRQKPMNHKELCMIATIKSIADETGYTYGKRRMRVSLEHQGFKFGIHKTRSLMNKAQVVAIKPKEKHYYPSIGKTHVKASNILARQFSPKTMNTHWVQKYGV